MEILQIPELDLQGGGVMVKYLRFSVQGAEGKRQIVRGVNYLPYQADIEKEIVEFTSRELQESSGDAGDLTVEGGGSITINLYYETITLFGTSTHHGVEQERAETAAILERAYPDYKVSWYNPEEEKDSD